MKHGNKIKKLKQLFSTGSSRLKNLPVMQWKTGNKITIRPCHALSLYKVYFVQGKQKRANEQERAQISPSYNRSINVYSL